MCITGVGAGVGGAAEPAGVGAGVGNGASVGLEASNPNVKDDVIEKILFCRLAKALKYWE